MAKKKATKTAGKNAGKTTKKKRPAGKRDLVRRGSASAYAKRAPGGQFKEMDDAGRSQTADRPRKASRKVKTGFGDQGDR